MINYKELHHTSLSVTDLEKAKQFYRDVLCLTEIERPNFNFPGAWFAIGTQQLHLIVDPLSQTIRNDKTLNSREGHFALRVDNYYDTINWLKKKNIEVLAKPTSQSGFAQLFCTDPDGNLIELNVDQEDL
ncbi:VOC family protein [Metabacillus herbersteinensis]|uniref:VOC family protein n=1 Tax=Metabacillus herbersteinensis TaxID=283816 RepID=A0ABV6GH59_9BACI